MRHRRHETPPGADATRRLAALLEDVREGVLVVDVGDTVSYASPAARTLLGTDPVGWHRVELEARLHPEERRATVAAARDQLATTPDRPARLGARLVGLDGTERDVELVLRDRRDDPDVAGWVVTVREVTEQARLERRVRELAFHDGLTGLHNRDLLVDRLDRALARARRSDRRVALFLCDLEDFNAVNEAMGHSIGDHVLRQLARRLRAATRDADTVARASGDLFGVLVEDLGTTADAITTARRLLSVVETPLAIDGRELRLNARIGIAVDTGERSGDELLRDADVALTEAKADPHQRWALHRASMTVRAQLRMELAADLTAAILDDEIEVAYQPVVSLATGQLVGLEALARWEHPHRGWVPPDEFIPAAEQAGIIGPLGDRVLDRTLRQLARWLHRWPGLDVNVAVNVSARQLREGDAATSVLATLDRHGIAAEHLVLELTESVMLQDAERSLATMHTLRGHGVRFAIDDFGTGYSSLSYLRQLPVDILKIDRSFITEVGTDRSADDLLRAILDLAARLRLDVVAEGIETPAQHALLTQLGADFAQGYLLGRPVAAELIEPALPALPRRPTLRA